MNSNISSSRANASKNYPRLGELPESLIDFLSQARAKPSRKRRRLSTETCNDEEQIPQTEYDYVVVSQSTLDFHFVSSKLRNHDAPLECTNVELIVHWAAKHKPDYVEIVDSSKQIIFRLPLSFADNSMTDITIALRVHLETKKWAETYGRLWTEISLTLFHRHHEDILTMHFTVKWNITPTPQVIMQTRSKPSALVAVLEKYFPDPDSFEATWSPQDFYSCAHLPEKTDDTASSITVDGLKTRLFPFQKRAVQWLLRREGVEWTGNGVTNVSEMGDRSVPNSFIEYQDMLGRPIYISHLFGLVTLDLAPFKAPEQLLKGGILAEEMGLGKSVEIMSLISLHKRPNISEALVVDELTGEPVRPVSSTLIVCPPSILQQWISEIQKHSSLSIMHYRGIKRHEETCLEDLMQNLVSSDVVVTTYPVLAGEIHFTHLNHERTLRRRAKYPRPRSPLMMLSWWRCVMDEVQMIESGMSNAAAVAMLIPRNNAIAVSGTVVRNNISELYGLLSFLRLHTYTIKHVWSSLMLCHKLYFRNLFGSLALRHSKASVRDEITLPQQKRYVISMPFSVVEEEHYRELFNQMCVDCHLDLNGAPLTNDWDINLVSEKLRGWLVRLRQTTLHPEVGNRNRRALGNKISSLRTIDQVLKAMVEQIDQSIRADTRTLLFLRLKQGQLLENSPRVKESLHIWSKTVEEAAIIVEDCRTQLNHEIEKVSTTQCSLLLGGKDAEDKEDKADKEASSSSHLGVFRNRLRGALEVEHAARFFQANAYFQIRSNDIMTKRDSPEFRSLENMEVEGYERAKKIRQEILNERRYKVDKLMRQTTKKASALDFVQIPKFHSVFAKGGVEVQLIRENSNMIANVLNSQAEILDEWREQTIEILLRPLVDEDDGAEITGDEYDESTKTQDEVMVFVQALRAVVADRHEILTGQTNKLVEYECKTSLRLAEAGNGAFPEKTLALLHIRHNLRPKGMSSMRGVVTELKAIATSLKVDVQNRNFKARNELSIFEQQLIDIQKQVSDQVNIVRTLESEVELFSTVINARLDYYRQLQAVSDMVAPYEGPKDELSLARLQREESVLVNKIAIAKSKCRYLVHLQDTDGAAAQRLCMICRDEIRTTGSLTICGHLYCRECMHLWWKAFPSHKCPVCKRLLNRADLHDVTYIPRALSIQAEMAVETSWKHSFANQPSRSIYSEMTEDQLASIRGIELIGPSFGTKVDMLSRHLLWLREVDPGAKSIIYSQYREFLDVLSRAFTSHRIGSASIDKSDGIEQFRQEAGVECILLHSRAHSSGLNLCQASHIFLAEPLLNTALELQAIARVHRIGQDNETTVWLYCINDTVEQSIYAMSVRRRMEHTEVRSDRQKGKAEESASQKMLTERMEEAESLVLQSSVSCLLEKGGRSGEHVRNEDLWECLFGSRQRSD